MLRSDLKKLFDEKVELYNQKDFIADDPISIPHQFDKPQDIEIAGLFAACLAWGLRKTIINKCKELMVLMDNSPHDFILYHTEADLKPLTSFKHRTFNSTDLLYFIDFLKRHYSNSESLESAFLSRNFEDMKANLCNFHNYFFANEFAPNRTRKHVATPIRKSSCKRLNMYLRWMIRKDDKGVDFGIWDQIRPSSLICPLDVHVSRTARKYGLIRRNQNDWQAAVELTDYLKKMDPDDPVKYDYALFGMGVIEKI